MGCATGRPARRSRSRSARAVGRGPGAPRRHGFTLLELLVVLAILLVLLSAAAPAMHALLSRNHLKAAAQSIAEDLQWARSESIARNRRVRVSFDTADWCYGVVLDPGTDCDCRVAADAPNACGLKRRAGSDFPGVGLSATFSGTSFDPARATAINGSLLLSSKSGPSLKIVLSRLGRVRICSPTGKALGYPACT